MKKQILTLIMAVSAAFLAGYDLKTKELVPVKFQKAPAHKSFKLVENGKLNFVIVADLKKEQAMRKTNKTKPSIAPPFLPKSIAPITTGIKVSVIETIPPIGGINALKICKTTTRAASIES